MSEPRRGIVEEIDPAKNRVRVKFPQRGNTLSPWLDVLAFSTHGDKGQGLPKLGNQCWVMLDAHEQSGCVLGCVFSGADPVPEGSSVATRIIEFDDGCRIQYDKTTHVLSVALPPGGKFKLCGDADDVAKANATKDAIQALTDKFNNHTHVAGGTMAAGPVAVTGSVLAPAVPADDCPALGSAQVRTA